MEIKVFLLLIGWGIFVQNLLLWRDIKSPAVLHSGMWSSILGLHILIPHGLYQLSDEVVIIIVASIMVFSLGSLFSLCIIPRNRISWATICPRPLIDAGKIYSLIALIGLPFFLARAISLGSHGASDSFMINVRMSLTHEDYKEGYGVLAYLVPIAYTGFFIKIANQKNNLMSPAVLLSFFVCMFYAVLLTGRTFLFLLLIPSFVIISIARPEKVTKKSIFSFITLLCLSFLLLGAVMGKLGGDDGDVISVVWIYLLGGISAFDSLLHTSFSEMNGVNSFRTFFAILNRVGFDVPVVELICDYAYIPHPTNVYTVFFPYFVDFGISSIFLTQFLFGSFHTVIYNLALRGSSVFIIIFSISIYPLFMQWFHDQYFSLLTQWGIFAALVLSPLAVSKYFTGLVQND
jgi:oligosaccharide repeat unit polymerase